VRENKRQLKTLASDVFNWEGKRLEGGCALLSLCQKVFRIEASGIVGKDRKMSCSRFSSLKRILNKKRIETRDIEKKGKPSCKYLQKKGSCHTEPMEGEIEETKPRDSRDRRAKNIRKKWTHTGDRGNLIGGNSNEKGGAVLRPKSSEKGKVKNSGQGTVGPGFSVRV